MNGASGVGETKLHAKVRADISFSDEAAESSNRRFTTLNNKTTRLGSAIIENYGQLAWAYNNKGPYLGVSGAINTWYPKVMENERSYSLVGCGKADGSQNLIPYNLSTLMLAGWRVSHENNEARIFVGFAINGVEHMCIDNNQCVGFIQVSHSIGPGSPVEPASIYGDPNMQHGMFVDIFRDHGDQSWWVSIDGTRMGYFDSNILTNSDCDIVLWGGLVQKIKKTPSPTEMGNGHFPNEGPFKTGEIARARVYKDSGIVKETTSLTMVTDSSCYDLGILLSGDAFLYGGPGSLSNTCS